MKEQPTTICVYVRRGYGGAKNVCALHPTPVSRNMVSAAERGGDCLELTTVPVRACWVLLARLSHHIAELDPGEQTRVRIAITDV